MFPTGIVFIVIGVVIFLYGLAADVAAPGASIANLAPIVTKFSAMIGGSTVFLFGTVLLVGGRLAGQISRLRRDSGTVGAATRPTDEERLRSLKEGRPVREVVAERLARTAPNGPELGAGNWAGSARKRAAQYWPGR